MATMVITPTAVAAERRFYSGIALAILLAVLVGFSRTFFLRPLFPDARAPSETLFYVHGAVATAWLLLFVLQTRLVATGRTAWHRRIGPYGALLALAMVVLGLWGALTAAGRATGFNGVPVPPMQFLAIPVFDISLFALFVVLAVVRRRDLAAHKRWMLLATINLLPAAFARWPGVTQFGPIGFLALTDLFILALAVHDRRTRGRLHPATLWGGLLLIASQPLRLAVSGTEGWLAFAHWATGLVA
ncbi:hypothetical protein [Cognatilysobacter segetis]|uniref:hypothetical protein n=1 Tax=Cognatilysobacter segetis TaxID=2492394 RepID=UPI001060D563|nr:hypothetical protein [Lysobacter segetis]